MDVFSITDMQGNKINPDRFNETADFIKSTCELANKESTKSSAPAIYGVAAAAEARFLRNRTMAPTGARSLSRRCCVRARARALARRGQCRSASAEVCATHLAFCAQARGACAR